MVWKSVAVGAVGVAAAIGLSAHGAAADTIDAPVEPTPDTTPTTVAPEPVVPIVPAEDVPEAKRGKLDTAYALNDIAQMEPRKPKATPTPEVAAPLAVITSAAPILGPVVPSPTEVVRAAVARARAFSADFVSPDDHNSAEVPSATAATRAPDPVPADGPSPLKGNATSPGSSATTTSASTNTSTATPPPGFDGVAAGEQWWPTWAGELVDQRLATAWRSTPVRGPPPATASALGNDGRTTIYQVSVIKGRDGFDVSIASQQADVLNAGIATAQASGIGSSSATGDRATTSIYQTSVIVQRGTGTATVEQDVKVSNLGVADATSAGIASAQATGNTSSTSVNQLAVILLLGSGDAQVSQATDVTNAGVATAVAVEDHDAMASGNAATTDVNQLALLVVHNEDVTINQSSSTVNIGYANAGGGTAVGNNSTNTVNQVFVAH